MKTIRIQCLACMVAIGAASMASACAKPDPVPPRKMVKAEVFEQRYQRVGMAETMHVTEFMGVMDGIAVLRVSDMSPLTQRWKEKRIAVKLADLDPAFRAEVEKAAKQLDQK